jgi:hypothetical protein
MAILLLMTTLAMSAPGTLQEPGGRLLVFLDCSLCDMAYVQKEITFVTYVRDREGADVHLLVTAERTASGGRAFTLAFIGQGPRAGHDQTLVVSTQPNDSEEEIRASLVQTMRLGLLRYLAGTDLGRTIVVEVHDPAVRPPRRRPSTDGTTGSSRFAARSRSSGRRMLERSTSRHRLAPIESLPTGR